MNSSTRIIFDGYIIISAAVDQLLDLWFPLNDYPRDSDGFSIDTLDSSSRIFIPRRNYRLETLDSLRKEILNGEFKTYVINTNGFVNEILTDYWSNSIDNYLFTLDAPDIESQTNMSFPTIEGVIFGFPTLKNLDFTFYLNYHSSKKYWKSALAKMSDAEDSEVIPAQISDYSLKSDIQTSTKAKIAKKQSIVAAFLRANPNFISAPDEFILRALSKLDPPCHTSVRTIQRARRLVQTDTG